MYVLARLTLAGRQMCRVSVYRIIICNHIFTPTVYTLGIREVASYITHTTISYVQFAPYIYDL